VPVLTRKQSREVDRIAMEDYGIPGIVLMENAARGIARAVLERFPEGSIAVACGPGNNGGDGFAAARHLRNAGRNVRLHLVRPPQSYPASSDAGINLAVARAMGLELREDADFSGARVILDALFGTGLREEVRGPYRDVIEAIDAAREAGAAVVAVDLPSGLDADSGVVLGVAVQADLTVSMVAPKAGFAKAEGPAFVGEVVVVDIGAPPEALQRALA
jgi:NAD(P)H-hydrate epimerase